MTRITQRSLKDFNFIAQACNFILREFSLKQFQDNQNECFLQVQSP